MVFVSNEVVWIKHYSSCHDILLVGEGDFSFSVCLASAFGSAINIVATSLDSYEELIKKYKNAKANLAFLRRFGATLLHGVDATKMKFFPDLQRRKFHRIIYNFPHAGFHQKENHPDLIVMHRQLVRGFFWNARSMLWIDGEIHVTHKIKAPFRNWKIEDVASQCSLHLVTCDDFRIHDFPGYCNKRGAGSRCDEPFLLGECRTFKFKLYPGSQNIPKTGNLDLMHGMSQNLHIPINMPVPFVREPPLTFNDARSYNGPTSTVKTINECVSMFGGYLNHVDKSFGSFRYDVYNSACEAPGLGFNKYMSEMPGIPLSDPRLHNLSIVRAEMLRQMVLRSDQQL